MTRDSISHSLLGVDSDVKVFGAKTETQKPRNVRKPLCSVNKPGCNSDVHECRRRLLDAPKKNGILYNLPKGVENVVSASALEPCGSNSVLEQGAITEDGPAIPTGPQLPPPRFLRTGNPQVHLMEDGFGFMPAPIGTEPQIVMRYTWTTKNRMTVQVITYGATVISIKVPDVKGVVQDVLLGFDDITGYVQPSNPYLGATLGRVASYIANANFKYLHDEYDLRPNCGVDHFNGGRKGFDKWLWSVTHEGSKIIMNHVSRAGTEGYPGRLLTSVTFDVTADNRFIVHMQATTDEATPVSLTNALRLNLAGHNAGLFEVFKHRVTIDADKYVEKDIDDLPTGKLLKVRGTVFDLRVARNVGGLLLMGPEAGYNHNMCITHKPKKDESVIFNSRVLHPESGRVLEIYSNQPGLNFSTCNDLPLHRYDLIPTDEDEEENIYGLPVPTLDEDTQVTEDDIDDEMFSTDEEGEEEEEEEEFGEIQRTQSQIEAELKSVDSKISRRSSRMKPKTSISLLSSKARASLKPGGAMDEASDDTMKMIAHRDISNPDAGGAEWWGKTPPGAEGLFETAREARLRSIAGRQQEHGPACSDDCPCRMTEEQRNKWLEKKKKEEDEEAARLKQLEDEERERLEREEAEREAEREAELKRLAQQEEEEAEARRLAALLEEEEEEEDDEDEEESEEDEEDGVGDEGFKGLRYAKGAHKKGLEDDDSTLRDPICKTCKQPESEEEEEIEVSDLEEEEEIDDVFVKLGLPADYITGKAGAKYYQNCALGFQTQKYPDAVHKKNFPSVILQPGEIYSHLTEYRFGICVPVKPTKAKVDAATETPADTEDQDKTEEVPKGVDERECKDTCLDKIIILP